MESAPLFNPLSYSGLYPEYAVLAGLLLICLLVFSLPRLAGGISIWVALISLAVAFFLAGDDAEARLPDSLQLTSWTWIVKRYFLISTSVALFSWLEWKQDRGIEISPVFFALLLLACLSLMLLVQASGLWMMLLAAEGFSFSAYALSRQTVTGQATSAAVLRYFGVGALATAVSVFGLSWVLGFQDIPLGGEAGFSESMAFFPVAGAVMFLAFLFFKLGGFPFQNWVPGIFMNAPTPLAGFFASAPKVASGFACLNLVHLLDINLGIPMVVLALLTGIFGNLAAFRSERLKELLAYSAIGQASFLIIPAIFARQVSGSEGHLLFFALAYGSAVQAAFSVCQYVENHFGDRLETSDFNGLFMSHPLAAMVFFGLLLGITGIPPTAGFMGKLLVMTGLPAGSGLLTSAWLYSLYFLALVNTVLAAGYFFRIPYAMFFKTNQTESHVIRPSAASVVVMLLALAFQLLAFFFPAYFLPVSY